MRYDVEICLSGSKIIERKEVDKVELLNVGRGVLSVIDGGKNYCFPLDTILWFQWGVITNKEDD